MRDLIIKYFALSYNVKLFGINFRYLRAVLPTLFFFCIAGVYTTTQNYQSVTEFTLTDAVLWLPVVICFWIGFRWFGVGYFGLYPLRYDHLKEWEQKHQYLNVPALYTREKVEVSEKVREKYRQLYNFKYKGHEAFVNPVTGFLPWAISIVTAFVFAVLNG